MKNRHLPDIPSENDIIKTDVNLGEINKLLTKKIEKLALCLIEKEEKEKALALRLEKLEKAVIYVDSNQISKNRYKALESENCSSMLLGHYLKHYLFVFALLKVQ